MDHCADCEFFWIGREGKIARPLTSNAYYLGCANTRSLFEHEYKQKVSNLHLGYDCGNRYVAYCGDVCSGIQLNRWSTARLS